LTAFGITKKILQDKGPLGFYKGISASYFGISETAMYFVFYEELKRITSTRTDDYSPFLTYVTSAGFSKTLASCICYPHGMDTLFCYFFVCDSLIFLFF
jgi:solute carrier family 25 protein 33/36